MQIKPKTVYTVLVTGNGPYPDGTGGHIDRNTSYTVASSLPKLLHADTAKNPNSATIRILTLPHPVKTEYKYARECCKALHDAHQEDVDLFVHLGEARGWDFVTVERFAFKEGMSSMWWQKENQTAYYITPDDAGQTIADLGPTPWGHLPMGLCTALDVDAVVQGAEAILHTNSRFHGSGDKSSASRKVQAHHEGGPFVCGFINYESLANRISKGLPGNVLFCHIPGEADEENLAKTRNAILAIIASAVNELSK